MKLKSLFTFKANIVEPCSKIFAKFKKLKPSSQLRTPTYGSGKHAGIQTKATKAKKSRRFSQCRPKTKFQFKKSFGIRRKKSPKPVKKPVPKVRVAQLMTVLFSLRKAKELEEEEEDNPIMADASSVGKGHFPSPTTPVFARNNSVCKKGRAVNVEESCRSFEKYLVEMIVEEGKLTDLTDVEELLYCWRNLKSPIFVDLVCRFYGELCQDLFSPSEDAQSHSTATVSE